MLEHTCDHEVNILQSVVKGEVRSPKLVWVPGEHGAPVGEGEGVGPVSKTENYFSPRFQLHPPRRCFCSADERIDVLSISSLSSFQYP